VNLVSNDAGCELNYTVHASVGGKIAQLGQRLIDGVAKSMAEDFFKRFDEAMQVAHPAAYAAQNAIKEVAGSAVPSGVSGANGTQKTVIAWVVAVAVLVLAIWAVRAM
jgi:hypothetical protein